MRIEIQLLLLAWTMLWACGAALAAVAPEEAAKAEAARKKPLQRCDQLAGSAELECLKKARERIVEARKKRESSGERDEKKLERKSGEEEAAKKK